MFGDEFNKTRTIRCFQLAAPTIPNCGVCSVFVARNSTDNSVLTVCCEKIISTAAIRIAYRCSTTASAGTTLPRSTALTCIASYMPDNLNNHTVPRERGKIGVISGCPGREESVTDGAGRTRLWPPAGPSSGWVGGKQNCVWFRRRIPALWRVFLVFVLSKGNAASPLAFHLHQQRRSVREFAILRYLTRWPK
jgi:hypothetical protein